MTVEARYMKYCRECRETFSTVEEAVAALYMGWEQLYLNPLGVWENGDKVLSHDDVLEWGEQQ